MINQIANILFIPEEFFESIESRKGIAVLREAQALQIIELLKENLLDAAFLGELKNAVVESDIVELINHKLDNLSPRKIVEAPSFEE
jgi:hypothetical protein